MELDDYQDEANLTDQRPGRDERALVFPLMGLSSEVGALVNQYKKRIRDGDAHALFSARVKEELGDVLWYVANLASKLDLRLNDIAQHNLRRTRERWSLPGDEAPSRLLDEEWPPDEQLPRRATVEFKQVEEGGRPRVRLFHEGRQIGNPLSDMAWDDDAYRFHDAFHLTYAAVLGWSPISRSFFGRQRESDARTREVEDSGRAKVIEEAIAVVAFEYARQQQFLESVDHLDFALLQTIVNMSSRLEVRVRTVAQWERAVLDSFTIWRSLRNNGGGLVHMDLEARTISFQRIE